MSDIASNDADQLIAALVQSFPEHIWQRLDDLGLVGGSGIATAIARGSDELASHLRELLGLPAVDQARSPLELVRDATVPVTAFLEQLGMRAPNRDAWHSREQPDDPFDLYPATSRDLGEEVWRLHMEWGISKAQAVAGLVPKPAGSTQPAVALYGVPAEGREELITAAAAQGYRSLIWRNPAALAEARIERPVLAIVHLDHPEAHAAIRALADDGIRTIAVGDAVDDLMLPGLMALGAAHAVASDRIVGRLHELLPRIA